MPLRLQSAIRGLSLNTYDSNTFSTEPAQYAGQTGEFYARCSMRQELQKFSFLWSFLQEKGCSLQKFGSAEMGLHKGDAIQIIDMLFASSVRILGIEVWREVTSGYEIDSLAGWYASISGIEANHLDAKQFIVSCNLKPNDVVTIQF